MGEKIVRITIVGDFCEDEKMLYSVTDAGRNERGRWKRMKLVLLNGKKRLLFELLCFDITFYQSGQLSLYILNYRRPRLRPYSTSSDAKAITYFGERTHSSKNDKQKINPRPGRAYAM